MDFFFMVAKMFNRIIQAIKLPDCSETEAKSGDE